MGLWQFLRLHISIFSVTASLSDNKLCKCVKATSRGEGQMGKHLRALCESFENYFFTLFEGLEGNVTQHSL